MASLSRILGIMGRDTIRFLNPEQCWNPVSSSAPHASISRRFWGGGAVIACRPPWSACLVHSLNGEVFTLLARALQAAESMKIPEADQIAGLLRQLGFSDERVAQLRAAVNMPQAQA